jgi:hypothetical protein
MGKKVISVRPAGRGDVFNLLVPDTHNYAISGGVIVSNCDETRYFCMTRPLRAAYAPMSRKDWTDTMRMFYDNADAAGKQELLRKWGMAS